MINRREFMKSGLFAAASAGFPKLFAEALTGPGLSSAPSAERVGLDAILHAGDFSTANTNVQFSPGDYRNVIRGVTNCYCEHGNTTRECCRFSVFVFDTEKGKLHELRLAGGDKPNPKYPERELRPNRPTVSTTAFDIGRT